MAKNKKEKTPAPLSELEILEQLAARARQAVEVGKQALLLAQDASRAADESIQRAYELLTLNQTPLTVEGLKAFATEFPQWVVTAGVVRGEAVKTYTRSLNDLHPSQLDTRETYLRFADAEYFDYGLIEIFGSYSGSGESGSFPHFSITAEEAGPITVGDTWKVRLAEEYLHDQGLFEPLPAEEVRRAS